MCLAQETLTLEADEKVAIAEETANCNWWTEKECSSQTKDWWKFVGTMLLNYRGLWGSDVGGIKIKTRKSPLNIMEDAETTNPPHPRSQSRLQPAIE